MSISKKRRPTRPLTVSLVLLIGMAASSSVAVTCHDYSLKENFDRMDVVFTGTMKEKQNASKRDSQKIDWGPAFSEPVVPVLKIRFKVHEEWKGELGKHASVYTVNPRKSSFGYDFKENQKYVVFARFNKSENIGEGRQDSGKLMWTSWCSHNLELGSASRKRKQSSDRLRAFLVEMKPTGHSYEEKNPFLRGVDDNKELFRQLSELKSGAESTSTNVKPLGNEIDG
ncbi:MAG: hypothetical protein OXG24_04145 [Gammaproteobacteria bacterium]|nr:hypothetical protein [Gammaproteobacteria bacterium]